MKHFQKYNLLVFALIALVLPMVTITSDAFTVTQQTCSNANGCNGVDNGDTYYTIQKDGTAVNRSDVSGLADFVLAMVENDFFAPIALIAFIAGIFVMTTKGLMAGLGLVLIPGIGYMMKDTLIQETMGWSLTHQQFIETAKQITLTLSN